jgi:orotidine-5'-phosphate decarboxylase
MTIMENNFTKRWHEAREKKGSNIVAGVDPAVFEMGRGVTGLPKGVDKLEWSLEYIDAVAPHVACVKANAGYFGYAGDRIILKKVVEHAHALGMPAIVDAKISDIGPTSDAWMYDYAKLGFDATTIAPYAGNIKELVKYAHGRSLAAISMGLMSNPEYRREMNFVNERNEQLWKYRTEEALAAGADGIVVGGTYTTDDPEFLEFVEITKGSGVLYLVPGINAQGGEVGSFLASGIDKPQCMISSSRALMFPNGSNSNSNEQAKAAETLKNAVEKYE